MRPYAKLLNKATKEEVEIILDEFKNVFSINLDKKVFLRLYVNEKANYELHIFEEQPYFDNRKNYSKVSNKEFVRIEGKNFQELKDNFYKSILEIY